MPSFTQPVLTVGKTYHANPETRLYRQTDRQQTDAWTENKGLPVIVAEPTSNCHTLNRRGCLDRVSAVGVCGDDTLGAAAEVDAVAEMATLAGTSVGNDGTVVETSCCLFIQLSRIFLSPILKPSSRSSPSDSKTSDRFVIPSATNMSHKKLNDHLQILRYCRCILS